MGRWIHRQDAKNKMDIFCSKCGELALGYSYWECDLFASNFCPFCGIEMENSEERLFEQKKSKNSIHCEDNISD